MQKILLVREIFTNNSTIGRLHYSDSAAPLYTLELPWRGNARSVSCIPAGMYICTNGYSSKNKSWGKTAYTVSGVEGRDNIQIHVINSPADTHGCIGIGISNPKPDFIAESVKAMGLFMCAMGGKEFILEVTGGAVTV